MLVNANSLHIPLADESIQCVVTSPPYYGLRDYGVAGQLGLEPTPEEYIANLVAVSREVWRVLRDDGVYWINIGDSYAGSGRGKNPNGKQGTSAGTLFEPDNSGFVPEGLKPKDLMLIPARVAIALQTDGWYIRAEIIWAKPNPMPESVKDRPTRSHEMIYLLTKQERYFYDAEAVKEDTITEIRSREKNNGESAVDTKTRGHGSHCGTYEGGRNLRDVWHMATEPYSGAHYATFPTELPRKCIKAGSRKGDIILDPFCGSGTTGQVARELGRRFIGLDLSAKYLQENALPRAERKQTQASIATLPLFAPEAA